MGYYNLKILGILLIATFATLIAFIDNGTRTVAIGILGAIAGYLFGITENKNNPGKLKIRILYYSHKNTSPRS